jgi:hypothetical protein
MIREQIAVIEKMQFTFKISNFSQVMHKPLLYICIFFKSSPFIEWLKLFIELNKN